MAETLKAPFPWFALTMRFLGLLSEAMNAITIARFWSKVKKSNECWIWTASKRAKGYGAFVWADESGAIVQGRAHRFSWELHRGPIPQGKCVLHNCPTGDNPACVNPDHLFLGTKAENNDDMHKKGRAKKGGTKTPVDSCRYERGSEHHNAKLNPAKVRQIRELKRSMSYSQLSDRFGMAIGHLFRIVNRKVWKHVK